MRMRVIVERPMLSPAPARLTMKMLSPVHSATKPYGSSMMASSKPERVASSLAIEALMYAPVTFALGGMILGSCRRQEDTVMRTPFFSASSPR